MFARLMFEKILNRSNVIRRKTYRKNTNNNNSYYSHYINKRKYPLDEKNIRTFSSIHQHFYISNAFSERLYTVLDPTVQTGKKRNEL